MIELIRAIKILGLPHLLRVRKIKKVAGKILGGFFLTRVINALLYLGFFDEFSKSEIIDIDLFSEENGIDERILHLLCDYLDSLKILKKHKSGYSLTAEGRFIIEMVSGLFDIAYSFEDIFHNLESLLKKEKLVGKDTATRLDFEAKGAGAAARLLPFPIMIDIINKRNFKKVLDIGCGSAMFLSELCRINPEVIGYGIDISREAILYGRRQLAKNNLQDRVTLLEGNILNILRWKDGGFNNTDLVTASFVLHELFFRRGESLINFLIRFRQKFKNKPLMVCENIELTLDELRKDPGLYSELQLAHGITRERQMTRKDWQEVFRKSGFKEVEERYLAFAKISIYIVR